MKHRRVVFLGRKHVDHARKVALMASQHPRLKHLPFQELPRLQHEEVALALQEALLFLSCGHPEGFGLPLAEAIACGCLVVGYHGLAGRDFATPHMEVVEFGDLLGLLKGVERELDRFDAAPEAVIHERIAASEAILQTYSLEAELDSCLRTWAKICPETRDQRAALRWPRPRAGPSYRRAGQLQAGELRSNPALAAPAATPLPKCTNRFLGQRSHRRLRARALRRRPAPRLANLLGQAKSRWRWVT